MSSYAKVLASVGIWLAALGYPGSSKAQQSPVTAIDIALEPDATDGGARASGERAAARVVFPKGFSLDATHHPHLTMLQRFVRTADLEKIYAAASKVFERIQCYQFQIEGVQILLSHRPIALGAYWLIRHRGVGDHSRTDQAAAGFDCCGGAILRCKRGPQPHS